MAIFAFLLALMARSAAAPVYANDIAPIINARCAPCHHENGPGPFPLVSYADVRKHVRQIVEVTRNRYMPPWLPQADHGDFASPLRLTDDQIELIARWVVQGAPAGDLSQAALPQTADTDWSPGPPDAIVQASAAFEIPASGGDVYWNFVLAPDLSTSHFVRALEIRMQNPKLIHHANIIVDRLGTIAGPFAGMDVTVPHNPLDLDGHFLFFKPGKTTYSEPDGFGWRLDPHTKLILNTHLQPAGKAASERPTVAIYFTDKPPTHQPYLLQLENDDALNIPAGVSDFVVGDDFRLPLDTEVLAVYPHAHYLGRVLEAYATLPVGVRRWLIRIPAWDPNWQSVYRYREPVTLPAGSVISMRYHYDNSAANPRNPNRPPKRVEAGDRSTDEMAHLWLQVMPKSPSDSRVAYAEEWAKHELHKNYKSYMAELTLGSLALARFDAVAAVEPLQRAVELRPWDAIAHNLYGSALAASGRNSEAREQFQEALKRQPDFPNARFNLAHALAKAGKKTEAIQNLQEILKSYPNDAAATAFLERLAGE